MNVNIYGEVNCYYYKIRDQCLHEFILCFEMKVYSGFLCGMRHLIHEEGLFGLWRGLGPCLISVVPQTTVYFTVYEQLKRSHILLKSKENIPMKHKSTSLNNDVGKLKRFSLIFIYGITKQI